VNRQSCVLIRGKLGISSVCVVQGLLRVLVGQAYDGRVLVLVRLLLVLRLRHRNFQKCQGQACQGRLPRPEGRLALKLLLGMPSCSRENLPRLS